MSKAHSTILLYLTNEVLREIVEEKTTATLRLKLESRYITKLCKNRLYSKHWLYHLCIKEGMPLKDHIDKFNKATLDLRHISVVIDDEDQALILLCSLLPLYENFIDTMLYGGESFLVGDIKDALQFKKSKNL